jgi:hypothetical protein
VTRYDPERQITLVREDGVWRESWIAVTMAGTKKEDLETGEDSKGQ